MIEGHGDDLYRYGGKITKNFSSNIYCGASLDGLKAYLAGRLDVMGAYPEPEPYALEAVIAGRHGIGEDCVLVTSGATEAIYLVAQAFGRGGRGLSRYAVRRPTFSEYDDACRMFGYSEVPFGMDCKASSGDGDVLRWICNPNNPTGEALSTDYILGVTRRGGMTVVDQSYEDYTLAPMLSPRDAVDNPSLILLHSMTKTYAVPGLRLGYVTAAPETIAVLRGCLRPWAVNALAVEAGLYLFEQGTTAIPDLKRYITEAETFRLALDRLPGISVGHTSTGFMLAEMARGTAAELKEWLARNHGMLIRDCSNFRGLSRRHFRVASRSAEDNVRLVEAVSDYMGNLKS